MKPFLFSLTITALALLVSPQALRADQPVAISGTIVDWSGKPIAGAIVSARSSGSTVVVHADKGGNYALLGFGGDVAITVEAIGYIPCVWTLRLEPGDKAGSILRIQKERELSHEARSYYCDIKWTPAQPYDRYVIQ